MNDSPIRIAGKILREYRVALGLSQKDLAMEIYGSADKDTTVSNWEKGIRVPDLVDVERFAWALLPHRFELRTGLIEVWRSIRAVEGFHPRRAWSHNYPATGVPGWVWLRTLPDQDNPTRETTVRLVWGPFHAFVAVPMTAGGAFVQAPMTAPNPPLEVYFEEPEVTGWIEFGTGVFASLAAGKAQIKYFQARGLVMKHIPVAPPLPEDDQQHRQLLTDTFDLADNLKITRELIRPHLGALRPGQPSHHIAESNTLAVSFPETSRTDDQGRLDTQLLVSGHYLQAIRRARGMSRRTAAAKASDNEALRRIYSTTPYTEPDLDREPLPDDIFMAAQEESAVDGVSIPVGANPIRFSPIRPITLKQIEHLELEHRIPAVPQVLARLDRLYQADGTLSITRTYRSEEYNRTNGRHEIRFPEFWVGPIWIQPHHENPAAECTVELLWDTWARTQLVRAGAVLTTRQAVSDGPALRVTLPEGWSLTAGTGLPSEALNIGIGWYPASKSALRRLILTNFRMVWRSRKFLKRIAELQPVHSRK